jgi:hypothetical protein
MATATLVKTTQDGRKLEVVGLAILLDKQLEAFELIEVKEHPNRRKILEAVPDAVAMAGRVPLNQEQVEIVKAAFAQVEAEILASPQAMNERFRIAANRRAAELGIE